MDRRLAAILAADVAGYTRLMRIEKLDRYADVGGIGIELERRRKG